MIMHETHCKTLTQILCNMRTNVQTIVTISLLVIQWALIIEQMNVKIVIFLDWRNTLTLDLHNVSKIIIVMIILSLTAVIQRTLSLSLISVIITVSIDVSITTVTNVTNDIILIIVMTEINSCHVNDVDFLNTSDITWSWKRYFFSISQTQKLIFSFDIIIKLSI